MPREPVSAGSSPERFGVAPRVLHVAAVDYSVAQLLAPQLRALQARGFDVTVACRQTRDLYWSQLREFHPTSIDFPRSFRPVPMLRATRRLTQLVRQQRPDIVHLHTPAASLPVRSLPRLRWPAMTRVFYTVHGYAHPWPPTSVYDKAVQKAEQWGSRRTHTTLFQSTEDFAEARRRSYPGNLVLLGNGIGDEWFEVPDREPDNDLSVLFVGRLVREKGVLDLVRALARAPRVRLHVVGDVVAADRDEVKAELHSLVSQLGLEERVVMHGAISASALRQVYQDVDVLCLPSYREGVPRSVIEALAAGRPAFVSNIRGCNELVEDGVNGRVFEPGDWQAIGRILAQVAATSPERRRELSRRARASVDPGRRESQVFERLADSYAHALRTPHR